MLHGMYLFILVLAIALIVQNTAMWQKVHVFVASVGQNTLRGRPRAFSRFLARSFLAQESRMR